MPTWNPRVGDSGEDQYHWGTDHLIEAGTSAYSNPPTLPQVNAGSGLNQIVAETKRQGGGGGLTYTNTSALMGVSWLNAAKDAIDALRVAKGRGPYAWTVWPISTAALVSDQHLYELRRALVEPIVVNAATAFSIRGRNLAIVPQEPPYPPTNAKTCSVVDNPLFINGWYWLYLFMGQEKDNASDVARAFLNFTIPSGISNATARFRLYLRRDYWHGNCDFTDYAVELYRLDTAIPVPSTQQQIDEAWAAAKTLVSSVGVATLCPARATYYEREFTISGLSTGALTICFANSGEIAGIRPNRDDSRVYVEFKHVEAFRLYNGVYARLIFE